MPHSAENISPSHLAAARAVDHLRRQLGIVIEENGRSVANIPVESLTEKHFNTIRLNNPSLLITAARAKSLGLSEQALKLDITNLSLPDVQAIADPLLTPLSLDNSANHPASEVDKLALTLAKHAALLPALLLFTPGDFTHNWPVIAAADAREYFQNPMLDMLEVTRAKLPISGAENAVITCFRERFGTSTHLVLIIGTPGDAPIVRVHSSCITGDILGSLRCDCGDQLALALAAIKQEGSGILLYLHQEGRGIGIANKLRAYQLQERGLDTYEANLMLGFDEDERDFALAGTILKTMGVSKIRMLTNNPHKMASMQKAGITVTERLPLIAKTGEHNKAYLNAKGTKAGHLF